MVLIVTPNFNISDQVRQKTAKEKELSLKRS